MPSGVRVAAPVIAAWTVACCAGAIATWMAGGLSLHVLRDSYLASNIVMALSFVPVGGIVAFRRPANPLGWLLLAFGGFFATATLFGSGWLALRNNGHAGRWLGTIFLALWPVSIYACLPLILQLFPTGVPAGRRRGWLRFAVVPSAAIGIAASLVSPSAFAVPGVPGHAAPLISPSAYHRFDVVWAIGEPLDGLVLLGSIAVLLSRFRSPDDAVRRQVRWLLWAASIFAALNAERFATGNGPIVSLFGIALLGAAVGIALVHERFLDIDVVIRRTVVYAVVTTFLVAAYIGVVDLLDLAFGAQGRNTAQLVAAGVVAVVFAAVRTWTQRLVETLLFGHRRDPYTLLTSLGRGLAETPAGDEVLETITATIATGLRLPYVAISVLDPASGGDQLVAERGTATTSDVSLELHHRSDRVGTLLVGVPAGDNQLTAPVRRALSVLADQIALAVRNAALQHDLRQSHERLVSAREEERRRVRNDLHDGLGPQLTGVTLKADAARNLVHRDPASAERLIAQLRADTTAAIEDVRRLIYGLRPPALDALGLLGALGIEAQRLTAAADLDVQLRVPRELPPLSAAVEVAAYRIVTEALTNVARHSMARRCVIDLRAGDALLVEITDDGAVAESWSLGVGLSSMRSRAVELGGTFTAGPTPFGGQVSACLPLVIA